MQCNIYESSQKDRSIRMCVCVSVCVCPVMDWHHLQIMSRLTLITRKWGDPYAHVINLWIYLHKHGFLTSSEGLLNPGAGETWPEKPLVKKTWKFSIYGCQVLYLLDTSALTETRFVEEESRGLSSLLHRWVILPSQDVCTSGGLSGNLAAALTAGRKQREFTLF